jgi:hypothetical protein
MGTASSSPSTVFCSTCRPLLTIDGLKQAWTEEGFPLRQVNEYRSHPHGAEVCLICPKVQDFVNRGEDGEPLVQQGGVVRIWAIRLEGVSVESVDDQESKCYSHWKSRSALCASLLSTLKPFNYLSLVNPRQEKKYHPSYGFLCVAQPGKWANGTPNILDTS